MKRKKLNLCLLILMVLTTTISYAEECHVSKTDKESKYKHGLEVYNKAVLPVFISGNIYYNGAKPFKEEKINTKSSAYNPEVHLVEEGDIVYLYLTFDKAFYIHKGEMITTELLGKAKIPNAVFDNPDGTSLKIDEDYFGNIRSEENNTACPFIDLDKGKMVLEVWNAERYVML